MGLWRISMVDDRGAWLSEPPSIFLSYRRDDASHLAGRLADRLADQFRIFMDVEAIEAGTDFAEVVHRAVNECHVLLAIIGPRWLNAADEGGRRRLDRSDDWVSEEIGAALDRGIRVIPVLVDGARMPEAQQLPARLGPLAHRQAFTVHHETFTADVARLVSVIGHSGAATPSGTAAPATMTPAGAVQRHTSTAASASGPPENRRRVLLPAGVIVVLAGVIVGVLIWNGQREATTSAGPSTSPVVVISPVSSAPPPASVTVPLVTPTPEATVRPKQAPPQVTGGEIDFRHFRVTVTRLSRNRGLTTVSAKVCVRRLPPNPQGDRTRISWGPWTVATKNGRFSARNSAKSADLQGMFPPDSTYRVGTCAAGRIPFPDVARPADVESIRYRNGVGDVAEWRVGS